MHTGAHPDDEDTALIARLARGDHARVAYLSLNRGEGGQNIIGTELFDALGVIRTEELLQARTLDGGDQFFTRAFDFGFTKTREEAAAKWNERVILGDMVRGDSHLSAARDPARFTGTPADGHGQHQLAGTLTPLAFKAAADPTQFPEQLAEGLRPWQARKLYVGRASAPIRRTRRRCSCRPASSIRCSAARFAEIAMEGRSQHKSQEMGGVERARSEDLGPRSGDEPDGRRRRRRPGREPRRASSTASTRRSPVSPTLAGLPAGALPSELAAMDSAARAGARRSADVVRAPATLVPVLAARPAPRRVRPAPRRRPSRRRPRARPTPTFCSRTRSREFEDALVRAVGRRRRSRSPIARPRRLARRSRVSVQPVPARRRAWSTPGASTLGVPAGWTRGAAPPPPPIGVGRRARSRASSARRRPAPSRSSVTVAADAPFTQPYWLAHAAHRARVQWTGVPAARRRCRSIRRPIVARVAAEDRRRAR